MPTHAEKRLLPHTPEQMFDMVGDVARYPEFLPWCVATRIKQRGEGWLVADLVVGYRLFRETFTSRVDMDRERMRIDVTYTHGPFKYLNNHWVFERTDDNQCLVDFYIDFEFKAVLFRKVMGAVFNEAISRMVNAFEKRADELYGRPSDGGQDSPADTTADTAPAPSPADR
jgi:coenzyme Q-binding protein COQ10